MKVWYIRLCNGDVLLKTSDEDLVKKVINRLREKGRCIVVVTVEGRHNNIRNSGTENA